MESWAKFVTGANADKVVAIKRRVRPPLRA
jgi:hypothetical protein